MWVMIQRPECNMENHCSPDHSYDKQSHARDNNLIKKINNSELHKEVKRERYHMGNVSERRMYVNVGLMARQDCVLSGFWVLKLKLVFSCLLKISTVMDKRRKTAKNDASSKAYVLCAMPAEWTSLPVHDDPECSSSPNKIAVYTMQGRKRALVYEGYICPPDHTNVPMSKQHLPPSQDSFRMKHQRLLEKIRAEDEAQTKITLEQQMNKDSSTNVVVAEEEPSIMPGHEDSADEPKLQKKEEAIATSETNTDHVVVASSKAYVLCEMPAEWTSLPVHDDAESSSSPNKIAVFRKRGRKRALVYEGYICPPDHTNMPLSKLQRPPKKERFGMKYQRLLEKIRAEDEAQTKITLEQQMNKDSSTNVVVAEEEPSIMPGHEDSADEPKRKEMLLSVPPVEGFDFLDGFDPFDFEPDHFDFPDESFLILLETIGLEPTEFSE
ncbi:hypothetical protein D9C73_017300 [Collichthys lucidus]|uniref:Uncharacterized protein n=1 Tax=Collichthys lucidus TaxID=240159 RepID=A0A4U5V772_COLLU|nr:hypothetical protein D9C73_017300 [Collichthys lucidus]